MWARHGLRRLSVAAAPCRYASTLVIGEHVAGALAAGTYHAIGAANQLGGDVSEQILRDNQCACACPECWLIAPRDPLSCVFA